MGSVSTQTLAIDVTNVAEQGSTAFRISVDGAQQVPGVISGATGLGTAIFDGATSSMSITINVQGLDWGALLGQPSQTASPLDDVNGAHIHNAPRGENGPIVLDWVGGGDADDLAVCAVLADQSPHPQALAEIGQEVQLTRQFPEPSMDGLQFVAHCRRPSVVTHCTQPSVVAVDHQSPNKFRTNLSRPIIHTLLLAH